MTYEDVVARAEAEEVDLTTVLRRPLEEWRQVKGATPSGANAQLNAYLKKLEGNT